MPVLSVWSMMAGENATNPGGVLELRFEYGDTIYGTDTIYQIRIGAV